MKSRDILAVCVAGLLLTVSTPSRADEKELRDKIAAIEKELQPIKQKAQADPSVKAARETARLAQEKAEMAVESAMIQADPKAKVLLDQRKQLLEAIAALRNETEAKKQAPGERKPKKVHQE